MIVIKKDIFIGFLIGLALIIPGLSASSLAIIFKVYDNIIYSISDLFKDFKKSFLYLFPILIGVLIGTVLGFFIIKFLLDNAMLLLVFIFAGLMIGSIPSFYTSMNKEKCYAKKRCFLIGLIIPLLFTSLSIFFSVNNQEVLIKLPFWFVVCSLFIGVLLGACQIIPGASSTAILLILGLYKPIMDTFNKEYIKSNPMILFFYIILFVGFLIGIIIASKLIKKFYFKISYVLFGLLISSIITLFYNMEIINNVYSNFNKVSDVLINLLYGIPIMILSAFFISVLNKRIK